MVAPLENCRLRFILGVACILAGPAMAQDIGVVSGVVRDPAGVGIFGAQLSIGPGRISATSNDHGEFRLAGVAPGSFVLSARRLGYAPDSVRLEVAGTRLSDIVVRLTPLSTRLAPVVVRPEHAHYSGRLGDYYRRLEQRRGGVFITREQIDREKPRMLSYLLQHVAGIRARRMRAGGAGVAMRGRNCWPLVWIDGTAMPAGEVDLDAISPTSIQGIEIYLGATTTPIGYQFNWSESSCGTILIWSRGPDTDSPGRTPRSVQRLEQEVAAAVALTADQVDSLAIPDPDLSVSIVYPPSLFAAGLGGTVVAEFIVDEQGRVEPGTLGIVSSPDPQLSEAVRAALEQAVFRPALRRGLAVRQVVQQPFSFVPKGRRTGADEVNPKRD